MKSPLERSPLLAPAQAFVIQFGREMVVDTGRMAGRVEMMLLGMQPGDSLGQERR